MKPPVAVPQAVPESPEEFLMREHLNLPYVTSYFSFYLKETS